MIKRKCCYIILMLLCSCATKKYRISTSFSDIETGNKIIEKGITLKKSKICYIYTTQYEGKLPGMGVFGNIASAQFIPTNLGRSSFLGAAASSSKADTIITNALIVQTALQETINNSLPEFQYRFVPQQEFIDETGKLNTTLVSRKYKPDIIINLTELSLRISGDANTGTTVMVSQPMMEMPGVYSSISPNTSFYGNILMDYTATWEILNIKEKKRKSIRQNGRYILKYYKNYSLYEEMMASAKKIGKEFSSLISENNN